MEAALDVLSNYFRTGALMIIVAIVLYVRDRSKFLSSCMVVLFGAGLSFALLPQYALGFQVTKELDSVTSLCCAFFGVSLIASSLVWFLTRSTRDGTVPVTLMTAQVFSASVLLLCQVYIHFGKEYPEKVKFPWSEQHVYFGMVGSCGLLLTSVFYLLRSHDFSGYPQHNIRINEYLRMDAGLVMILALTCLAFPDIVFKHFFPKEKVTTIPLHLIRCAGAMVLNTAFVSLQAAGFLHENDKRQQFISRLVGLLLLLAPFMWGAVYNNTFTLQQVEMALVCLLPLFVNGVLGLMAGGTSTYTNKYH